MAQVVVSIGGRNYRVACAPGEEPRIKDLAAYFQSKVELLGIQPGTVSDPQLLVLAALLAADELSDQLDAYDTVVAERDRLQLEVSRLHAELANRMQSMETRVAQSYEKAAGRLEQMVTRLFEPTPA